MAVVGYRYATVGSNLQGVLFYQELARNMTDARNLDAALADKAEYS